MADAPDGDEADGDGLEGLDNMDPTVVKEHMKKLEIEQERQTEMTERLQVKLKVLNGELAARKEEVERIKQEQEKLHKDKRMASENQLKLAEDDSGKMDSQNEQQRLEKVRKVIEEEVSQGGNRKRSAKNEIGMRMYDEMELMVEKPAEEQKMEATYIDTVLITLIKAMTEERFYLTYRVDKYMTCKKLREDACLYWGISEVEYILRTVSNSKLQDDVTVQNAFDRVNANEDAHLLLMHKNPFKTSIEASEEAAIAPRAGAKARKKNKQREQAEAANEQAGKTSGDDFYEQMDTLPGFKAFMIQREDPDCSGHVTQIRLQSILLYFCLGVGTLISIVHMRPPVTTYINWLGSTSNLIMSQLDQDTHTQVPDFNTIRSTKEAWMWLETTLPNYIFNQSSNLRQQNLALGYIMLRMQHVKPPSLDACHEDADKLPAGINCMWPDYSAETAGIEDLVPLKDIWTASGRPGTDGRAESPVGLPWKFVTAEEMATSSLAESQSSPFTRYDASGYTLVYNMQFGNGTLTQQAFKSDMALLQSQGWISHRTRAIHVHFTLYNGNFDFWESNWYTLGMPASGVIHPWMEAQIYRPTFTDYMQGREQAVTDIVRGILVAYMITFHFYMELGTEKSCSSALSRATRIGGILDIATFGTFLYIVLIRYFIYGVATDTAVVVADLLRAGFINDQSWARTYDYHILCEAAMLAFVAIRCLYYTRVNRQTFIIFESIRRAFIPYGFFLLVLLPVLIAFTVLGHTIWRADMASHRSLWGSFTSTLMMLCGDYEAVKVSVAERPWTLIYLILFYIFINLVLVNAWVAAVVHCYQQVRVGFGYNPNDHQWSHEQYINWLMWGPLARGYLRLLGILKNRREAKKKAKEKKGGAE